MKATSALPAQAVHALVRYYSEAGPDYAAWSPGFNMHFGYYGRGANPFDREAMLEQMTRHVTASLVGCREVIDLGCGLGASARSLAKRSPGTKISGVTIVPWQCERARQMTAAELPIEYYEDDYTATRFYDEAFDGAFAIESFCHGPGRDKRACIEEAWRILKPGGELIIADGFLKTGAPLCPLLAACHRRICNCWAMDSLPVLPAVLETLRETGFAAIEVSDISWNVAPSVAHVPLVTLRFLFNEIILHRQRLNVERWNNLLAPLVTGIVGLARHRFGYYMIRAAKGQ